MKSVSIIEKVIMMSDETKLLKDLTINNNMGIINEFIEKYVNPHLPKEYIDDINKKTILEKWKKLNQYSIGFMNKWAYGYMREVIERKHNYLNHQKILPNMLKNSSKIYNIPETDKEILGKAYVELINGVETFEEVCNDFFNTYIVPILKNEKKIIFDLNSSDENTKFLTQKTVDLFLKYLREHGSMAFQAFAYEYAPSEDLDDIYNYFNFLFVDNIEAKKYLAKSLCETFIENYEDIDLTEKTSVNIFWLYEFVPPFFLEEQ